MPSSAAISDTGMIYPWQQSQWEFLSQQFAQNRYPHAILCRGPQGLGKLAFAKQLAAKILCDIQRDRACGCCQTCQLFLSGSHPDFYHLYPDEKGKLIKIAQVRELIAQLSQTAHTSEFRVVMIEPLEAMNQASSNALLKNLEEPVGQVIFILVAHQLATVPATILSRCQAIKFHYPSPELAIPWLLQQKEINDNQQARQLLQLAGGSPLQAVVMADSTYQASRRFVLKQLWLLLNHEETVSQAAEALLKENAGIILSILFSLVFDVFKLSLNLENRLLQNQDCINQLHKLRDKVNLSTLTAWLPTCLETQHRLQTMSGINTQLSLEALLIGWCEMIED